MDPLLDQPYAHLVQMLTTFAASMQSSQPAGPPMARWARAAAHLGQELKQLNTFPTADAAALPALEAQSTRLTQLARTQDGLRFEHSAAVAATQLADERRLVVFAAWQLLQALERVLATAPGAAR